MSFSGSYFGMHQQDPIEEWNGAHAHAYAAGRKFRLLKSFHPEDYITLQAASPGTGFVYRHHIQDSHQGEFIDRAIVSPAEADRAADDYIRQFSDSVNTHMNGNGHAESVNEEYPTRNPDKLAKIVAFDRAFVRRLPVICPGVRPIVFTAAVGNPDHHEYGALVDLARETAAAGGAFGYHAYWTVHNGQSFVNDAGVAHDLHMRWEVIDEYLVARGIHVDWMLGELGATRGNAEGYQPDVIKGWKSSEVWGGNEDAYLADIANMDALLAGTRAAREGRLLGATLFTSRPGDGGTWHLFNITGSMMWKLANYVASKEPVVEPPPVIEPPPPPDNIPLPDGVIDYVDQLPMNTESDDWPYETRPLSAIENVVIHHSVGQPTAPPESIAIGHINRNGGGADGWPGIGYHFYILGDGTIYKTNHLTTHSYHVGTSNRVSLGVCLAGDFTDVHPSPEQLAAARYLLTWLDDVLDFPTLMKHRDFSNTQCPGNTVSAWWDLLTEEPVDEPEPRRYDRTYHLLPQDARTDELAAVVETAHEAKQTVGYSVDDAFVNAPELTKRTVHVWDVARIVNLPDPERELEKWVETFYPPLPTINYRRVADLFVADRWSAPVGTKEERAGDLWPGAWFDANPFLNHYSLGYHTGSDLNNNSVVWDYDRNMPVWAAANGRVTYAGIPSNGWQRVVVMEHRAPDGSRSYSRYAHLGDIVVNEGQWLKRGQMLGIIGRNMTSDGPGPFHLHFDISHTTILLTNPGHWPGENRQAVVDNYLAPEAWIEARR